MRHTVNWHSQPTGISGTGTNISFDPSSLAPTTYTVVASASLNTNCFDTCTVTVVKVDSIDITSLETGASGNPPPFEGHKPWPFDSSKTPPDKHMVVFYNDVIDSSFNVQDFDVTLTANILPSSITGDMLY